MTLLKRAPSLRPLRQYKTTITKFKQIKISQIHEHPKNIEFLLERITRKNLITQLTNWRWSWNYFYVFDDAEIYTRLLTVIIYVSTVEIFELVLIYCLSLSIFFNRCFQPFQVHPSWNFWLSLWADSTGKTLCKMGKYELKKFELE